MKELELQKDEEVIIPSQEPTINEFGEVFSPDGESYGMLLGYVKKPK